MNKKAVLVYRTPHEAKLRRQHIQVIRCEKLEANIKWVVGYNGPPIGTGGPL